MQRWLLILAGAVVALVVVVGIVGLLLPKAHIVSSSRVVAATPEVVWETLTDYARHPSWRSKLKRVERVEDRNGHEVWQDTYEGGEQVRYETTEADPPRRLVRTIADVGGPFSGRWEFSIEPAEGGTRVTITEYGEVPNPIFRFVSKFIIGHSTSMSQFLDALAAKLGTPPLAS